jgi:hypothetical protein
MLNNLKSNLRSFVGASKTNLLGKQLRGKYLIIESDDWGAIRTPSKEALKAFEKKGMDISSSIYKYDSLASEEDLDRLFEILKSHKDFKGNCPKITANVIMANPDFERIKQSGFREYFFEPFPKTLERYPEHTRAFEKWKLGIEEEIFIPQFHGREHLNINRWLKALQSNNEDVLYCFDHGATFSGKNDYSFMEAYDWDEQSDVEKHKTIIAEGLEMFHQTFGYKSLSFIAPCYNWDKLIEPTLFKNGVKIIQGIRSQMAPTGKFEKYEAIRHYFGEINSTGLFHNIRNCYLEPSQIQNINSVDTCLAQIRSAFLLNKPAVISSHRINYIGYIEPKNRERGIAVLNEVLKYCDKSIN